MNLFFTKTLLILHLCSIIVPASLGFTVRNNFPPTVVQNLSSRPRSRNETPVTSFVRDFSSHYFTAPKTALCSSLSFRNPTQEESVQLGIREWPQQTKSQPTWDEEAKVGETLTRYILQGSGDLTVTLTDSSSSNNSKKFSAGLLVEVSGPATLNWVNKGSDDIIILTPGYEQGGLLAGVAFLFVVLCGSLIAGVGS